MKNDSKRYGNSIGADNARPKGAALAKRLVDRVRRVTERSSHSWAG
jgi:hypothetical protein